MKLYQLFRILFVTLRIFVSMYKWIDWFKRGWTSVSDERRSLSVVITIPTWWFTKVNEILWVNAAKTVRCTVYTLPRLIFTWDALRWTRCATRKLRKRCKNGFGTNQKSKNVVRIQLKVFELESFVSCLIEWLSYVTTCVLSIQFIVIISYKESEMPINLTWP